ncbi:MAG: TRAM domain-containing protein [Rhabdochlamydiaceae bacterium]|nr:TRAM domain-containing protein [Candidatus Amphrikana amoebophyrae]
MNSSLLFSRIFFTIITVIFFTIYSFAHPEGAAFTNTVIGVICGLIFSLFLFAMDIIFRRFNLRSFNIAVLGLFFGFLMGQALLLILDAIFQISMIDDRLHSTFIEIFKIAVFILGLYLGVVMTLRASDELYISIPFVKFAQTVQKKKDIIIDKSVLCDARIIDLCSTGILDNHLVVPRFLIKEFYGEVETGDEQSKIKAKRALDVIKKLEGLPNLEMRFNDTDFPDIKDLGSKLLRLARLIDANMITADITRVQMASIEGIKIINVHSLSNALKPLMDTGEFITIKIQRYGKEPRQGVGYLEDGTMVVVNGGGNYIGEIIEAQVLSVKHTSSGRMIFCNAPDETGDGSHPQFDEGDYEDNE